MKLEHCDTRVLGAIRWVDAVTRTAITQPLAARSSTAILARNHRGLSVIRSALGLEKYRRVFVLSDLPAADVKADESVTVQGEVRDPSGAYLPRAFTVKLPRPATSDAPRPANSLFAPMDIHLLPSPQARTMAGWAQVRVTVRDSSDALYANVLVRVVAATGSAAVLGRGMSDGRGEALVIVPDLPLFQPGATPEVLVTSEIAARIEFIPPGSTSGNQPLDWTTLDALTATAANRPATALALKAGATYSLNFKVSN
jgi:hypothetical protein